ncbi:MAG: ribosome small subunit-dependent GTPase A [Methylophilaceae bacterium]|nr:ribosome small subunit-dependent GTPase A [Methylophilaceae bacterium]
MTATEHTTYGLVVSSYGKRYDVELPEGRLISCVTRGKKSELACGDRVEIKQTSMNEGVVERWLERRSLFYRSNAFRKKLLAANVTQVIIVLAARPSYHPELLDRCLVAAEAEGVRTLLLLNKADLPETAATLEKLRLYEKLGYAVLVVSAKQDVAPLRPWLAGQTSILVGQSGMGKSTLINALLPTARARTREISTALDSGKHTTTATRLYRLDPNSSLIDSPGLQEFGLAHLTQEQIESAFIEFRPFLGRCRFNDCRHLNEPDCAIRLAVERGDIALERLRCYHRILQNPA